MPQSENIGFIGLGNMGGPIALRLLRAGYSMTVLDLMPDKMKAQIKEGARRGSTPGKLARVSSIVIASLHAVSVEEVVYGKQGIMSGAKAGLVFVNLSTTPQEMAIRVSDALRERGVETLDAPVSGAAVGARNGKLTVFVGGTYPVFQRCLPFLQHIGHRVTYLGQNGNGQLGKRINGLMEALCQLAIYDGLNLAQKLGLDPKMFAKAASAGCAQSWRLDEIVRNVFLEGNNQFQFRLQPGRTGNALQMANSLGISLPGTEAAHQVFSESNWRIVLDFEKSDGDRGPSRTR